MKQKGIKKEALEFIKAEYQKLLDGQGWVNTYYGFCKEGKRDRRY
jgi:hypothetical protein